MPDRLAIIGAPSSAGAYAPGQEKAPTALRDIGLAELLSARGIPVDDRGDVAGFRWRADQANPRAMNASAAATVAKATAEQVAAVMATNAPVLVLGGDCTVELGTVAGSLQATPSVGVVYIDLDTDLNTPQSTEDGALDWMGVAHCTGCVTQVAKQLRRVMARPRCGTPEG
jgi:arginase